MCLAVPGKIIDIADDDPMIRHGRVDIGGVTKVVNLSFVPDAQEGDYVIVHAGFALNTVDETEALLRLTAAYVFPLGARTALSPEFVYALGPGALMADDKRFGILWMEHETLAAAYERWTELEEIAAAE